jgi:hypothetical protein
MLTTARPAVEGIRGPRRTRFSCIKWRPRNGSAICLRLSAILIRRRSLRGAVLLSALFSTPAPRYRYVDVRFLDFERPLSAVLNFRFGSKAVVARPNGRFTRLAADHPPGAASGATLCYWRFYAPQCECHPTKLVRRFHQKSRRNYCRSRYCCHGW